MEAVTDTIKKLAQPLLESHGFYLVDIEYVKEGPSWYLRLYIDKPGGIDIEECALINQELSDKLDATEPDLIDNAYFLEVSSPGAERPLKTESDLKMAIGQYIHVSLYQKQNNQKIFEGTLLDYDAEYLNLEYKNKTRRQKIKILRKNIAAMRLAIEF
ncbi:MAG: ribosome maturation factor RimP [Lactobacillus sp.]|uniref:Ribosome maturation factor RimP n=1 Tax=Bombilactobacillus bombi TaxID=1303590 RepID=A0A347SQS1_9LACO|nr:ribosome maturation factor RimP [Bombilactobacillus bombi]AXX64380.1 ribosome maturation factor RimP [Bombilactobacillus bombi]MCO6542995.1 ribosome maturation factor RimP [Lactobacillus sp.]RHW48288.1 ribosome maturation factor RimP [Bombilactobacillus bombi]RHW49678.1 ribosome maturation factor RimP [Bombilactobacillus bombi]